MGKVIEIEDALWARLSTAARRKGRTAETVVRGLIQDFLEIELDRKLDEAIARDVRGSGHEEKDAVRLVREYRKQIRTRRARRVGEPSRGYRRAGSR